MNPELRQKFDRLENQKQALLADVASLSPEQLRFRPQPTVWTILDVLDHLIKTEKATFAMVREQLPAGSPVSFKNRFGGIVVTRLMRWPVRVKVPAGATMVFPSETDLEEISSRWIAVRQDISGLLQSLELQQLRCGVFRHPVSGWMTISQTLAFTSAHLRHHVYQVERLKKAGLSR